MNRFPILLTAISAMALAACQNPNTAPPAAAMTQPTAPAPQGASTPPATTAAASGDPTPAPGPAPGGKWHVMTYRCDQLIGLDDDDRAAAVMFYYGYLAAQAHFVEIDASRIEGNVRRVIDRCAKRRQITVVEAFKEELGPHRVKTPAG
jgi:hypothetical protein